MAIRKLLLSLATAGAVLAGSPAMAAVLEVYKTPWCGCCTAWAEAFRAAGYDVQLTDMEDLTNVREEAGVAEELQGCHTAKAQAGVLLRRMVLVAPRMYRGTHGRC